MRVFVAPAWKWNALGVIKKAVGSIYVSIEVAPEKEYYALSSAQKRLYILNKLEGGGLAYNMPGTLLIEGDLDKGRLENAFNKLIERHEVFRTSFEMADGEPVQRIHENVQFRKSSRIYPRSQFSGCAWYLQSSK